MRASHYPVILLLMLSATDAPGETPQYVFQLDLKPITGMRRGNKVYLGHLDEHGDFIESRAEEPYHHPSAPSSGIPLTRSYRLMKLYPIVNVPKDNESSEKVYEYRSGRLILGVLDSDGYFTPEAGSTIMPFADYRYSDGARRIYNLPGKFVPAKDKPGQ